MYTERMEQKIESMAEIDKECWVHIRASGDLSEIRALVVIITKNGNFYGTIQLIRL